MAAAPPSLGTQIREELTCSICLELFTRPKVLPCQHTFCQDCLRDHAEVREPFQCPNCRMSVRLPPQGVAGLPDNYLVSSLCEKLQQQANYLREKSLEKDSDSNQTTNIENAAHENRRSIRDLLSEGRDILESYYCFIRGLRDKEKSLNEQKQQTDNSIIQSYNQLVQKLTERKDHLLSEAEQNHRENSERLQDGREGALSDINALSAACDQAEQEMEQVGDECHSHEASLTTVIEMYRRIAPVPLQAWPVVFQPTDTPVPVLGHVTPLYAPTTSGDGRYQEEPRAQGLPLRGYGSESIRFSFPPTGVAVSDEEEIFVAESRRIQVFTLHRKFLRQFATVVADENTMEPHDVAVDREGNLWVVGNTPSAEFVVHYSKHGMVLVKFELQHTRLKRGIAVDTRRNYIFITQSVSDWFNCYGEVQVFKPERTLVKTLGGKWTDRLFSMLKQGMGCPNYIAVDGEGKIFVSDSDNHCVFVYSEDGQFLFQFGSEGNGEGHLKCPQGVCTDRVGNVIVADRDNKRVEMFDKTGRFMKHITTDIMWPRAVAMTTHGQLVVTDLNHTVSIFYSY